MTSWGRGIMEGIKMALMMVVLISGKSTKRLLQKTLKEEKKDMRNARGVLCAREQTSTSIQMES